MDCLCKSDSVFLRALTDASLLCGHPGHRQGCSEGSGAGDSANEVDSTSSTIAGTPATHSSVQRSEPSLAPASAHV